MFAATNEEKDKNPPEQVAVRDKSAAISQHLNPASDFPGSARHDFSNKLFPISVCDSEACKY